MIDRRHLLLGVREGASRSELRSAFHARAAVLHPDVNPAAADEFRAVTEAYHELLEETPAHAELVRVPRPRRRQDVASAYGSLGRSSSTLFPTGVYAPLDCSVLMDRTA